MTEEPHGELTITTLGQIEAISSPVRVRILRLARKPITVAELADRLGVPNTRLYYHVNLLVEQGMLTQVDERKSGARIEKVYLRAADAYTLGLELADEIGDPRKAAQAATAVLLDPARAELEDVVVEFFSGRQLIAHFGRSVAHLTPAKAKEFSSRMDALAQEFQEASDEEEPGRTAYSLTAALVPIEIEEEQS